MDDHSGRDGSREYEETQNNLRQASAALEAAYRRITLLRQSLLDLTDSTLSTDSQTGTSNTMNVGPAHEAILFSAPPTEDQEGSLARDMARLRSSLPSSVMDRLEQFEAEFRGDNTSSRDIVLPPAPSGMTVRQLPPLRSTTISLNSPTIPIGVSFPPSRRSLLESHRRDADDPSTALGRRVAAREAGQVANTTYTSIPQLQQILLDSTATIARNLESLNNSLQQRVQNSESASASVSTSDFGGVDGRSRRGMQGNNGRGNQSPSGSATSVSTLFAARPTPHRRLRTVIVRQTAGSPAVPTLVSSGSGQSTSGPRLSALSNFTVDNLSTPVTPLSHERPILFDEPDSYVPQNSGGETLPEGPILTDRYFLRRRMNPDGDELNAFWYDPADDSVPSLSRRQSYDNLPSRRNIVGTMRTERGAHHRNDVNQDAWPPTTRPSAEVPRRRRGWARLDADGNEIPTDEEDQLERLRSEHRIRTLYRPRSTTSSQTDVPAENTMAPVVATSSTRTTTAGELDATIALMRINRREPGTLTGALDSVMSLDRSRRLVSSYALSTTNSSAETMMPDSPEMYGSSLPFLVDPLPMPLTAVMPAPKDVHGGWVGKVPKHASWAGR